MSKDDSERMADELRAEALKRIADLRSDAPPAFGVPEQTVATAGR
jgi:hypothetical protein